MGPYPDAVGAGPTRRCVSCDAVWRQRTARYCGVCGAGLGAAGPGSATHRDGASRRTSAGRSARGPSPGGSTSRLALGGVVIATLAGAVLLGPAGIERLDADGGPPTAADDGSVELVRPRDTGSAPIGGSTAAPPDDLGPTGATDGAVRSPGCRRSDRSAGSCGPRLVDRNDSADVVPLDGGSVLIGLRGDLVRVEVATGTELWRSTPLPGIVFPRVAAHPTTVLVTSADVVAGVDAATGRVRWRTFLPTPPSGPEDAPKAAAHAWMLDGGILVLDGWQQLHALDPADGQLRWTEPDAGGAPVVTSDGIVTTREGLLRGWEPGRAGPRWEHAGSGLLWEREEVGLRIRPPRHDAPLTGPVPLVGGRELLDLRTGERTPLLGDGVIRTEVLPEITLVQRWPGAGAPLEVTAYGAGSRPIWQRSDLPIPCCLTLALGSASQTFALAPAPRERAVILRMDDGSTVRHLERDGGTLVSITDDVAIWRTSTGLVGEHLATGRESFRATGAIRSNEPLLLSGPGGILAVTATASAPPDIARPRLR